MNRLKMGNIAANAEFILFTSDTARSISLETVISHPTRVTVWQKDVTEKEEKIWSYSERDFPRYIDREISVNGLVKAIKTDEGIVRDEVKELLRSYDVPLEYTDRVISWIRESVRSRLGNLPYGDIVSESLIKLYIHLAYELLRV